MKKPTEIVADCEEFLETRTGKSEDLRAVVGMVRDLAQVIADAQTAGKVAKSKTEPAVTIKRESAYDLGKKDPAE
jgi:hypothetical protein